MEDLISIVVPIYNCEKFIEETIKIVENQTYKNWELILINDCSTDRSKEIAENYVNNKIKLINLEKNSGAAISRNLGIENARGKYIAFLDADDLWEKDKLEKQIKFMKTNNYRFTYTSYEYVKEDGKKTGNIAKVPQKMNYKEALKNTTIFTSTVMLNVEELGKQLIMMPEVKSEDTATWWKILKQNNTAYGLDEVLTYYRRSSSTLSSNKLVAIKRIWNLYRKEEKLNIFYSFYCFVFYAINAVRRRI